MLGGLLWFSILSFLMILGFSYIIWILAKKETGYVNTTGQVIACAMAAVALIIFILSLTYGGSVMGGMGMGMMSPGMHKMDSKQMMDMMKDYEGQVKKYQQKYNR